MSDTPVSPQTYPPPSRAEVFKSVVGDLARPFAMYAVSAAEAWAILSGKDAASIGAANAANAVLGCSSTQARAEPIFLPIIWDCMPIFMVFYMHYQNFSLSLRNFSLNEN